MDGIGSFIIREQSEHDLDLKLSSSAAADEEKDHVADESVKDESSSGNKERWFSTHLETSTITDFTVVSSSSSGGLICQHLGCSNGAEAQNRFCKAHDGGREPLPRRQLGYISSSKRCRFPGCSKGARGSSGLCISHGGGRRCQHTGCNKGAEGQTVFCKAHGGGSRCEFLGCTKSAAGRTDFCIAHGGGRRCSYDGCSRAARGKSGLCIRHGGGKRCKQERCTRSAERLFGLCIAHGGRKCQCPGCNNRAKGSTCFCTAHGGGKKCGVPECTKSARGNGEFCVNHAGRKRCNYDGCTKLCAPEISDFCETHGGGKRCTWAHPGSVFGPNADACNSLARPNSGLCAAHDALVQFTTLGQLLRDDDNSFIMGISKNQFKESILIGKEVGDEEDEEEDEFQEEGYGLQVCDKIVGLGKHKCWHQKRALSALDLALLSAEEETNNPESKRAKFSLNDEKSMSCVESSTYLPYTVLPVFSIHNLHEHVKLRCIQHCCLLLQDEFERDKLVQLWIAEECIECELSQRLEDVAKLYFDALVKEEVIIPSRFDNLYGEWKFKVNTSKASTWFSTQGDYLRIHGGKLNEFRTAVHLSFGGQKIDPAIYNSVKKFTQLRTLVLSHCGPLIKQLPNDLFLGLKLLKTLDLSFTHLSDLPTSIGNLESLRYLDTSETPLKVLPESVDHLSLLQTLRLRGCFEVHALPKDLRKLINLRHLDLDIVQQLDSMPQGMGSLVNLQTLKAFLVGKNDGCGIGELKNMNDITGSFSISRLENVSNPNEALEAAISNKKHITKLELNWHEDEIENPQTQVDILEYLQLHFGLKELELLFYSGSELPSWISNPLFTDLASITLYHCINCHVLPSIGELPSLKFLTIVEMNNVRYINSLFCRKHVAQNYPAFPSLEKLTLDSMHDLETWSGIEYGDFPRLRCISIRYCPKLYDLPNLSYLNSLQHLELSHCRLICLPEGGLPCSLEFLIIRDCPKINDQCLEVGAEDRSKIEHVRNVLVDLKEISLD